MTVKRHCERSVAIQCAVKRGDLNNQDLNPITLIVFSHVAAGKTCRRLRIFCHSTALGMSMAMACMHLSSQPCLFCILSMALPRSLAMEMP